MEALACALLRHLKTQPGQSPFATAMDGLFILRSDHPNPPAPRLARPALCIVAQGAKWATLGGERLEYSAGQALLIGVETPTTGRVVEASPGRPCLVLLIELDLDLLREVAATLEPPPRARGDGGRGVFVTDFDGPLADCAVRLVRLLDTPNAIPALRPMILREIGYWLLTGPQGAEVAALVLKTSPSHGLIKALHELRNRYREGVKVESLARIAGLSASAFHRQFKALTGQSPLQYQKQLRLLEARRLMVSEGRNAETAAFEVGYESPSQFSRDYVRLLGAPPRQDANRLRASPLIRLEREAA